MKRRALTVQKKGLIGYNLNGLLLINITVY